MGDQKRIELPTQPSSRDLSFVYTRIYSQIIKCQFRVYTSGGRTMRKRHVHSGWH